MVSFLIKCGIEPYDIPFSIVSPAGGEHGMRGGVSVMKKSIFVAAAVFFCLIVLSCSDVFGGRETEGIAFTVPPLAPQSVSSPARAAAGGAEGPWSIYGFLFGEDADPAEINNIVTKRSDPLSLHEVQDYRGIIQAVSRKGADLSQPQPLFFQRIPAKTKCFVCILVTYTTSAKTEHTVFYGISPDSVLNQYGAKPSFTDNFYTPDTGENEISVTLKRDSQVPVCFATQNGASLPQESTPYKPTHFYGSHGGNMTGALGAVKGLPPGKAGVIILMDDIDVSGSSGIPITTESGAIPYYLNGRSVDFDSISGKRCKLKANEFSVSSDTYLSFRNILIAADGGAVSINEKGELRLGGAVSLDTGKKIVLETMRSTEIGSIIITSPLSGKVGEVSVSFRDPTSVDEMKDYLEDHPLVRDDTGSADVPACFGSVVTVTCLVPPTPHAQASFTARWKRIGGNRWALEARD
ncbi:hypothetical protein [Treponema sp. Marseille-Q4523]|uniref:hypothetical protein n=1 Tax=Treponema sp. Marseille-Q4523 TaxID=2810610 RepID=UPI001960E086|nr:hypothetical protein [Treponema sp. Marseille-Q4523]MBM7023589.1 hypothetical protein [Treponema sp. Marseille-Q4523]